MTEPNPWCPWWCISPATHFMPTPCASGERPTSWTLIQLTGLIDKKNITYAPNWTFVQYGASHRFTLYFAPLPKRVIQFDLREIIPQPGGWHIQGIRRNREDVYQIRLPN
ncbi:MAG: hypothetical protein RJA37_1787 [Verrucomicrobiota bacterium]